MRTRRVVFGIDFSGAQDAGNKIWIARGVSDGGGLLIQECFRARDLSTSGRALKVCLPSLVTLIQSNPNAVFGFDFPFGLPASLVRGKLWKDFVLAFSTRFKSPDDFKRNCFSEADNQELRRDTDKEAHTPFSPYNLRIYKQTFYGIREILHPVVRDNQACVLPMQKPSITKPWILEICPASTLKIHNLYQKYKYRNRRDDHPETRSHILKEIEKRGPLRFQDNEIREAVIQDRNGDALDSVIAAFATFRAVQDGLSPNEKNKSYMIEGYVYV